VSTEQLSALLNRDAERLIRYYDAIFLLASTPDVAAGISANLPSPEVVYCARHGVTPLRKLRDELEAIRNVGGLVRGIVLWNAERPILPAPKELVTRTTRPRAREPRLAVASR
jgi:hypothetical protein